METMFVEMAETVGSWEKGSIQPLRRSVAEGLIAAGQAKASDAVEHMRSSLATDITRQIGALKDQLLEAFKPKEPPPGVRRGGLPGTGTGVDYGQLSEQGTPAAEQDKSLCLAEAMRCIFLTSANGVPHELAEYARQRLRCYTDEYTEYKVNPSTGKLDQTVTRQLADGGLEVITRTGTDSVSGGPSYGFTLKPNYISNLFRIAREAEVFAGECRKIPVTEGNEAIWPGLDQFSAPTSVNGIPQAAVFAGVSLQYLGETIPRVASDAKTFENRFKIVDLTALTTFSRNYIVDNYIAMDSEITQIFGQAVGWIRDWTYIRGDGIAKPQGYFNANCTITGGPSTGARYNSNEISADDLAWMMSHCATMCWPNIRWIANVTTFPQLYILRDKNGNAVFQPNALIDQAMVLSIMKGSTVDEAELVSRPMGVLMGKPLYLTEKVPVLGTTGDISLACPYQYGDATRAGLEFMVSDQVYFLQDEIAYRGKMRHYGRALWKAAYQQADGSNTLVSPFVILHS